MRDSTIDIAKGIGIFLVVLGHFAVFASSLYHYIYLFHMPLFFFISGMFAKPMSIKECLVKKAKRLLVPYLFYWIFNHLIQYTSQTIVFHDFSLRDMNLDILVGGVLWFLISLWSIYLIYTIGCLVGKYAYFLYSVISIIGLILGYNSIRLPFYLSQTMLMLPFFLIGNIFKNKHIKGRSLYRHLSDYSIYSWPFLIAVIIYFIPCGFMDVNGPVIPNILQFFATPLSGIIIVLMLSRQFSILWKKIGINELGKNSLHILGVHSPFVSLFWIISIPVLMKVFSLMGRTITGEEIKGLIWVQLLLAVTLTSISYRLGLFLTKLFPRILK